MILGVTGRQSEMPGNVLPVKRHPMFGFLSIASPIVGMPIAYLMALASEATPEGEPAPMGGVPVFMMFSGLAVLLGLVLAMVALIRGENLLVSLLGLCLSGSVILCYFFVFLGM